MTNCPVCGTEIDQATTKHTTEYEGQDFDAAISQLAEDEEELLPATRPALRMN